MRIDRFAGWGRLGRTGLLAALLAAPAGPLSAAQPPTNPAVLPPPPPPPPAEPGRPPAQPITPTAPAEPIPAPGEALPGIRIDREKGYLEFEGFVPIDAHDPDAPRVYLELVACSPDTREHESLVVTSVRPAHLHAGLLLLGLEPGRPGRFEWEGRTLRSIPPEGSPVHITFITTDASGTPTEHDPRDWIISATTGRLFAADQRQRPGFVFAGSLLRERGGRTRYEADGTGTVIGLTTFGTEVVAWHETISPEAAIVEPDWIARREVVPKFKTPVTVRLSRPSAPSEPKAPDDAAEPGSGSTDQPAPNGAPDASQGTRRPPPPGGS